MVFVQFSPAGEDKVLISSSMESLFGLTHQLENSCKVDKFNIVAEFTQNNISILQNNFPNISLSHSVKSKIYSTFDDFVKLYGRVSRLKEYNLLYTHQKTALVESLKFFEFALLMETGTGKTPVAILNMEYRFLFKGAKRFLVIAKPILLRNWELEIKKWSDSLTPIVLKGSMKDRIQTMEECCEIAGVVFIINYEAISYTEKTKEKSDKTGKNPILFNYLSSKKWDCLVLDESQKIKNPQSNRTKYLLSLSNSIPYKLILTGTPVTENPMDCWAQFELLNPNILGFRNYFTMRNKYCYLGHFKNIVGYKNLDDLREKIIAQSARTLKKDCLDLPEKVFQTIKLEMPEEMDKQYDDMVNEFETNLGGFEKLTAKNILVMLMRLSQIVTGMFLKSKNNPKIEFVQDIIEDNPSDKITIWYHFDGSRELLETLMVKLGVVYYTMKGGLGTDKLHAIKEGFINHNGQAILLAQDQVAGEGITLTCSTVIIFYENYWSRDVFDQKQDRHHRIGLTKGVVYYMPVYENSIEIKILEALERKKNIMDEITGDNIREQTRPQNKQLELTFSN